MFGFNAANCSKEVILTERMDCEFSPAFVKTLKGSFIKAPLKKLMLQCCLKAAMENTFLFCAVE